MICFCGMFKRQTTGSVVCASCGSLVGVNDETCYSCGRRNPGPLGLRPDAAGVRQRSRLRRARRLRLFGASTSSASAITVAFGGDIMGPGNPLQDAVAGDQRSPGRPRRVGRRASVPSMDRWWTVLSASWLHGGALHILFNMLWVRQLGPATADIYGPGRMVIIYTVAGAVGFTLSSFAGLLHGVDADSVPARRASGRSAPRRSIFGLLGALVYYGSRGGSSMYSQRGDGLCHHARHHGLHHARASTTTRMPAVSSVAISPAHWLDPLKPERMDHLVGAALCLIADGARDPRVGRDGVAVVVLRRVAGDCESQCRRVRAGDQNAGNRQGATDLSGIIRACANP